MLKGKKQMLSYILVLSMMFCTYFSIPIKASAATIDDAEVGAGNQNVIDAQTWLNNTYSGRTGYTPIDIDGVSYSTTFITLVKAFQIELGFPESKITGTFGPQTKEASPTFEINKTNNNNMVRILQYGLRCKGYYDTNVTGVFDTATQSQIIKLQQDAGLTDSQISQKATPLVLQAALSTEIYVLAEGGNSKVREVQRALNRDYLDYIGIQPCDGIFGPNTVDSLITALQACEGLPRREDVSSDDDVYANGYFGNTTKKCCPSIPYSGSEKKYGGASYTSGEIKEFTKLLQYSLCCLKPNEYYIGSFDGTLNYSTVNALKKFQNDVALSQTGNAGINEWMALLVSTGNPDRPGTAIDCSTRLTAEKAAALKKAGYTTVGRYLTGDLVIGGKRVAKNLLRTEMKTIFDSGLNLFVIFQDAREAFSQYPNIETYEDLCKVYFTESRGYSDAEKAFSVAKTLGVPRGEIIYFTVDYDFVKYQVNEKILPYFEGIKNYANSHGNEYRIGIYSARNTCTIVANAGYSESSFVSDMSTGYSGNKGYPLPDDWAFDQIQETDSFHSSDGSFAIDKDVVSGRYNGFNHFEEKKDNEWDLISESCSAYVIASDDNKNTSVPVYWAKVKDNHGNFKLKYTMDDNINVNSFFVLKNQNYELVRQNDSIRYVYFRDKGGNLNAGYIDFKSLSKFRVDTFQNCQTSVDDNGQEKLHPYSKYHEFQVAKSIGYYDNNGNLLKKLPVGTIVTLPNNALTHKDYPNLIQISHMKKPSNGRKAITGYIDLGFEIGVTPKNRALITPSSATLTENENKVIYFLPGYMGSQLYEKDSGHVAWVDIGKIVLDIGQYRLSRDTILPASLKYGLDENGNDKGNSSLIVSSVKDEESGVYGTLDLDGNDSAKDIMDNLNIAFGEDYTIKIFPYDWRKTLSLSAERLETEINNGSYDEVNIVTHSTGGLLGAAYLARLDEEEKQKIGRIVTLGAPLFGTYTSHEVLELGNNDLISELKILGSSTVGNVAISAFDVRGWAKSTVRNTPCTYQLLPSDELISRYPVTTYSNNLFMTQTYDETNGINDFYSILNHSSSNLNNSMIDGSGESHKKYREKYLNGQNIVDLYNSFDTLHIGGYGTQTHYTANYLDSFKFGIESLEFDGYKDTMHGDGTILYESAVGSYRAENGTMRSANNSLVAYNVDHGGLLNNKGVFLALQTFIAQGTVLDNIDENYNGQIIPLPKTQKNKLTMSSNPLSAKMTKVEDNTSYSMENKLCIRVRGNLDITIYDDNDTKAADIINGECSENFNKTIFSYNPVNNSSADLYIPNSGYKLVFSKSDSNNSENDTLSIIVQTLNNEGTTSAAVNFDIPALLQQETVILNATSQINNNNIDSLALYRNETEVINANISKTDFATELVIESNKTISRIGETQQISFSVTPAETSVNWKSSNTSVATVDINGKVTATGYGYAKITAFTGDGSKTAFCYVCVPYNADSIRFENPIYEILVGNKLLLQPLFIPTYATNTILTYSSSDTSVISVEEQGMLTAVSSGTATITATTDNGKTARCVINVVDKLDKTVGDITINPSHKTITVGDEVDFTATIGNDYAINQNLSWSIENSNVAIIEGFENNKCIVKAVGYGETKLTATADDESCSSQATIVVNEPDKVVVHYHDSKGWDMPYIYYRNNSSDNWQIKPMLSEGDGWYVYTVKDTEQINALFYDNDSEKNIATDKSYSITGEKWILKGNMTAEQPEGIKVHYYCVNNWSDPHIYYYNENDQELPFPGAKMSPDGGNNWYTYTIYGVDNPRVVFNNNTTDPATRQQHPGINQPGIEITEDEMWVVNETAYSEKPQGITVHFYRPSDWEYWDTRIYFYEDNNILMSWPGTLMNSQMYDNWLTYTIYGVDNPKVILNDSKNKQIPGVLQPGHLVTQDVWFKDNTWTTYEPE